MSLGLEWAGMTTVGFCEIEPACRFWIREHWPAEPIFEDIRTLTAEAIIERCGPIDIVAGGFPCQDVSAAGKGAGLKGARSGLWFEMLRVVRELRPDWVLAENVGALRTRGADEVLEGLDAEGYACWPLVVGAGDAGAPQRRKRVWIVAHANGRGLEWTRADIRPSNAWADRRDDSSGRCASMGDTDGDTVREQSRRFGGARRQGATEPGGSGLGDAIGAGLALGLGVGGNARPERAPVERAVFSGVDDAADESGRRRADDARQSDVARPGDPTLARGVVARPGERQHEWEAPRLAHADSAGRPRAGTESHEGRDGSAEDCGSDGPRESQSEVGLATARATRWLARLESARRRARLRALGNTVYPQTVAAIGRAIMNAEGMLR